MLTIDKLNQFGVNTEEGLARCFGNEALYIKLVATIPTEKNFDKLDGALKDGNLDEAFEAAHALKGALGNLSLTPIYDRTVEITELLRSRTEMDYSEMIDEIMSLKSELGELCE